MSCCRDLLRHKAAERQNISFTLNCFKMLVAKRLVHRHDHIPKTLNSSRKLSKSVIVYRFKIFFIIKCETNVFKELLHSVSACGESMLCHNILSEREDSIPQRKIMFIDAKKTLIQSCENRNKNKLPRERASCWLVTRHKYICFNFFPPPKVHF